MAPGSVSAEKEQAEEPSAQNDNPEGTSEKAAVEQPAQNQSRPAGENGGKENLETPEKRG